MVDQKAPVFDWKAPVLDQDLVESANTVVWRASQGGLAGAAPAMAALWSAQGRHAPPGGLGWAIFLKIFSLLNQELGGRVVTTASVREPMSHIISTYQMWPPKRRTPVRAAAGWKSRQTVLLHYYTTLLFY